MKILVCMKRVFFLILATTLIMMSACDREEEYIPVQGIFTYPNSIFPLEIGDIDTLIASVEPFNATDKKIIWSSDNPDVATINSKGEIIAVAVGTATITAVTNEGGYMSSYIVDVIPTGQKKITFTTGDWYSRTSFYVDGRGTFTIDWGDGSAIETHTLPNRSGDYFHEYSDGSSKTITLIGGNMSYFSSQSNLISLDVSENIALTTLGCNINALTNLDVSNNIFLKSLSCNYNRLSSLNLSNNIHLKWLDCCVNQLTNLDLSKQISLTQLYCSDNKLTSLDVSKNIALTDLGCHTNQIANLDVSNNAELGDLHCGYNQLINLDVSKNTKLYKLDCRENKLKSLDVSRNIELRHLSCHDNELDADALNFLFGTLLGDDYWKEIYIHNNPGTNTCDRSIATNKGWTVIGF